MADRAAYEWAWKQEFANPLRPSTADELRWYFGQRRGRRRAAHDDHERDLKRYAQARRAFSAPRYRVLYRAWLREGARVIDATSSPALADAITRGAGRFEAHVLARPYLHLSSLVGRHEPSSWGDTPGDKRLGGCCLPPWWPARWTDLARARTRSRLGRRQKPLRLNGLEMARGPSASSKWGGVLCRPHRRRTGPQ